MPSTSIVPLVGSSSVDSIFMVVVLPAPFGPSRPKISPLSTRRSIPSTARNLVRRSGSRRSRCHSVYRPFSNSLTRPVATTAAVTRPAQSLGYAERHAQGWWSRSSQVNCSSLVSFNEYLHPVLVVGDVDELTGVIDRAEQLVEVDPELREVAPNQPARRELHLPHARDRERDGDVDLLLPGLGHADAQHASARARRHRRLRRRRRRWRDRHARAPWPLVDVSKGAEQAERLLDVDLAIRKELQDLLALVARHLPTPVSVIERGRGVVDAELATREALEHRAHLFARRNIHRLGLLDIFRSGLRRRGLLCDGVIRGDGARAVHGEVATHGLHRDGRLSGAEHDAVLLAAPPHDARRQLALDIAAGGPVFDRRI